MASLWCKDCGRKFAILPFELSRRVGYAKVWDVCPGCKEKQVSFTELWVRYSIPELDNPDLKLIFAHQQRDFLSQIDRIPTSATAKQKEEEFQYIRVAK